jgi:hypothetical protein
MADDWGVLSLAPGPKRQRRALAGLVFMNVEVHRPTWVVTRARRGRVHDQVVPVFFNYVLAKFDHDDPAIHHQMLALPGVSRVVTGRVTDTELADARQTPDLEPVPPARFKAGAAICVRGAIPGSFQSGDGTRSWVKVALLGRDFLLEVPDALCDPAESDPRSRSGLRPNRRRHGRSGNATSRVRATVPA